MPAPVVNVQASIIPAPIVNIEQAVIPAPVVNVDVDVPEQAAPFVSVHVPKLEPQANFDVVAVRNEKDQIIKWKRVPKQ